MWMAVDLDNIILGSDENLYYTILFNKKSDIVDLISSSYMDRRKHLAIKRIDKGYYIYHPKDCDGNNGNTVRIISIDYLRKNENLKNYVLEYLNDLLKKTMKEIEEMNENEEIGFYYKNLFKLKEKIIALKRRFYNE